MAKRDKKDDSYDLMDELVKQEYMPSEEERLFEKRKVKVANIVPGKWLILDFNGNGERLPFDKSKHSDLKVGDEIEI